MKWPHRMEEIQLYIMYNIYTVSQQKWHMTARFLIRKFTCTNI